MTTSLRLFVAIYVLSVFILGIAAKSWADEGRLPTTEEFNGALGTCAAGLDVTISADLLGSVASIYNGQRSNGAASFKTATKFLELFPERDRAKVYELYTKCISQILRVSAGEGLSPENSKLPKATVSFAETAPTSELLKDENFLIFPGQEERWVLRVDLKASFSDDAKNSVRYLSGVSDVSYHYLNQPKLVRQLVLHRPDSFVMKSEDHGLPVFDITKSRHDDRISELHWRLYVFNKDEPDLRHFVLNFGPITVPIDLQNVRWREISAVFGPGGDVVPQLSEREESRWNGATATVSVLLPDPSWILVYSANLLTETSKSKHVLELVVQNLSRSLLPLNGLKVIASAPWGPRCHAIGQWHEIKLDWTHIIHAHKDNPGAVTLIDGRPIAVPTKYTNGSCSTPYYFEANIPVNVDLAAGAIDRVYLEIEETPPFTETSAAPGWPDELRAELRPAPHSISDFSIWVQLSPSDNVFPERLQCKSKRCPSRRIMRRPYEQCVIEAAPRKSTDGIGHKKTNRACSDWHLG
jgi:hypothetical protein